MPARCLRSVTNVSRLRSVAAENIRPIPQPIETADSSRPVFIQRRLPREKRAADMRPPIPL